MKKHVISLAAFTLILTACNNEEDVSNEGQDNQVSVEEETEQEETEQEETEQEETEYTHEDLDGEYVLSAEDERVRVIFDQGTLRYTDDRGNVSYRIPESGDRIVISYETPEYYKITQTNNGFDLVQIDDEGSNTGFTIELEKLTE